jgi:hypothetical protein
MNDTTGREFFNTLLPLGPQWEVAALSFDEKRDQVMVDLDFRTGAEVACPICRTGAPLYDTGKARQWRHLDLMGRKTFLRASVPRVDCPTHGPQVLEIPWAARKTRFTFDFEEHVLRVLGISKSIAAASGLLKSGWGASDRIFKKVSELSKRRRASELKDAEYLEGRKRDLAEMFQSVEEAALDVARRIHRQSSWLSSQWADEIRNASGGRIVLRPREIVSDPTDLGDSPHDAETPAAPVRTPHRSEAVADATPDPGHPPHREPHPFPPSAVVEAPGLFRGDEELGAVGDSRTSPMLPDPQGVISEAA